MKTALAYVGAVVVFFAIIVLLASLAERLGRRGDDDER